MDLRRRSFEGISKKKKEERVVTHFASISVVTAKARIGKERENESEREEFSGEKNNFFKIIFKAICGVEFLYINRNLLSTHKRNMF